MKLYIQSVDMMVQMVYNGNYKGGANMGEVLKALGFIGLGVVIAEWYNARAWKAYYRGRAGR